mgnify:CR=1 FL=1
MRTHRDWRLSCHVMRGNVASHDVETRRDECLCFTGFVEACVRVHTVARRLREMTDCQAVAFLWESPSTQSHSRSATRRPSPGNEAVDGCSQHRPQRLERSGNNHSWRAQPPT